MRQFFCWLLLALSLLGAGTAIAQSDASISVTVPPPYSGDLSVWRSDPNRILLVLRNNTNHPISVRISGYAEKSDRSVRIDTKDNYPVPRIDLNAFEVRQLNGRDLSLTDVNAVRFSGTSSTTIARTGQLPEGNYSLCLHLIDYTNITTTLSPENCANFSISYLTPPQLITPSCDATIETTSPQSINFQWLLPSSGSPLQSRLQIIELTGGRSAAALFSSSAAIPIYDQTFSTTSYMYGPSAPALTPGHRYGWRVQAIDPTHTAIFQNNGFSTPCEFTFGTASGSPGTPSVSSITLSGVYPLDADTIPYLPPHLVVRFQPYSDSIKRMEYTLTVTGSDGTSFTSHRTLGWPNGPRIGQGWPDASFNDRSTYIVVNQDEGSGGGAPTPSPWSENLKRGVRYTWTVTAQFRVEGRDITATSPSRVFYIGVPPPSLSSPADRAEIAQSAQPVTLRWNEARPHQLNPPDILGMGGRSSSLFFGLTDENYRVQVSKLSTFASIDTSFTGTPESYHTGDNCDQLYAAHSHTIARRDTGWYYWRVEWLQRGTVYTKSPTWSFHIGTGTDTSRTADTTSHATDSGACVDVCSVPGTRGTTPSTRTYAAGNIIHVGRFNMTLTSVSGSGSSLTGEGTIPIPFLRAPIMVQFSGIGVNTGDSVFSGEVTAKQAPGSPISSSVANSLGSALGLDTGQVSAIQTFASQSANLVSAFTGATPIGLPIGLDNTIEGEREVIGIIGMVFKPSEARLNAVMSFDIPDMGPGVGIGLGARDICFTPGGFGGDGKVTLYLATDLGYRNPGSWGFVFKAPSSADSGTYLQFDCHGFLELRLAADVEFPRDWLKPDPDDGSSLVKAHFRATIRKTGDWIAAAGLDRCTLTGADGFGLEVQEMTIDHSDIRNPVGIVFPNRYVGVHDDTWQGFYIKRAALRLPDALRTFDSTRPPTIAVTNMLINRDGFTASFRAENVIQYPSGNFGEWGASIDTIFVNVVSSSLDSGGINGRIKIPVTDSSLIYTASLSRAPSGSLAFNFNIHPSDTINAPLWIARLYLEPTSHIDLTVGDSGFVASATLNGGFRFGGTAEIPVSLGGVHFANFQVMSTSPYLNLGTWSFASPQHGLFADVNASPEPDPMAPPPTDSGGTAGGFPLSIHDIGIVTGDRGGMPGFGLQFTISVNLMGGSGGISGGTELSIWGKLASRDGGQQFEFDGVQLDSVGIHGEIAAILVVDGSLVLYNHDPVFGDGFRAAIHANFLRQLDVTAVAQFGSVGGYRYWYVDAKAVMATGIPIFTGVGIYGFGGGVWSNMRMVSSISTPSVDPSGNVTTAAPTPGATNSGLRFVPDNTICFGFRAGVVIGTHPTSMPFNADVYFDASFLCSGGINDIGITGDGFMMAEVNDRSSAKVTMHVEIRYNFPDRRFQGLFTVSINADPFTGGGQLSIYADPASWYIHIGEPTPVSSQVHLSLADWLTIRAYVLIGQNLPSPPPLPPEIEAILGPMPMTRNPALARGDGFAFGASADINFRGEFLIFYAQLRVMLGFDLALLNFGTGATCEGVTGTMGMNGWYAMGQLYAYISASVGLHIDVFFWEGDMEILSVALAAALQGGAPNPTWLKGAVGGHYSVLGGAIEGNCRFEFRLGSECIPITESPLANISLINQLEPADGSRDVDVYTHPSAAIQFAIDRPFELTETDGEGRERVRTFRIKVRSCTLQRSDTRANVAGHWIKQEDAHIVEFIPDNLLNGRTRHTFAITVYGEEYSSYRWRPAVRRDGGSIDQAASASWTSGEEPDRLDARNINYSYPLDRQRYFLKNECSNGQVQLVQGVRRPFEATTNPAKRSIWKARFIETKNQSERIEADLNYSRDGSGGVRSVRFALPTLKNSTSYCIQLIRREEDRVSSTSAVRADIRATSGAAATSTMRATSVAFTSLYSRLGNTVGINKRQLPGTNVAANEQLLYYYYFNTSKYNRLSDKFAQVELASLDTGTRATAFQRVRLRFNSDELLDVYDMQGYAYKDRDGRARQSRPLIEPSSRVFNKPWHTRYANPYIYDVIRNFGTVTVSMFGGLSTQRYSFTPSSFAVLNYSNTLASYVGTPEPLMSDGEMLPPSPIAGMLSHSFTGLGLTMGSGGTSPAGGRSLGSMGSSSGGGGMMLSGSSTAYVPQIIVSFDQSLAVPGDQLVLHIQAAPILWMASGAMSSAQRTSLSNALSHPYEFVYDGTYPIDFSYWFCQEPDSPMPHVTKEFRKGRETIHIPPPRTPVLIRR